MKVTLDLTQLLRDGDITQDDYRTLSALAARDTGSVAFNILVGCGVVAVAAAALDLVPNPVTALTIGGMLMAASLYLLMKHPAWLVLANMTTLVGALMLGGGTLILSGGTIMGYLLLAAIFLGCALVARSALLVSLSVLSVVGAVGAGTYYSHAAYEIDVTRPLLTILVCGGLALAALQASMRLPPDGERLCLVAARTALFFANIGFWVGSLWGDSLTWLTTRPVGSEASDALRQAFVPPEAFGLGWAVALIGAGLWAARANRRWVVNLVAVFGAIHFYTQWFEHLSATPLSIMLAGLATLGIATGLWMWNQHAVAPAASA